MLVNYDHGFVKRGLLGALLKFLNIPYRYDFSFFAILSLAIFAVSLGLFIAIIRNLLYSKNPDAIASSFVYASSLGILFLAATVGYWDHLGLLLSLIALHINGIHRRLWFIGIAFGIAILIHEALALMFYPLLCISVLLNHEQHPVKSVYLGLVTLSVVLVVLTGIMSGATISAEHAGALYQQVRTQTDFTPNDIFFWVLSQNVQNNAAVMRAWWHDPIRWKDMGWSLAATLPPTLFFTTLAIRRLSYYCKLKLFWLLTAASALTPLALHGIGWDFERWNALSITTSFLAFVVVHQAFPHSIPQEYRPKTESFLPVALVLLVIGAASKITLLDDNPIRSYPFKQEVMCITSATKPIRACLQNQNTQ